MTDAERRMEELWLDLWRNTSASRRFQIGMEMMTSLRRRIAAGVRSAHPEWSEKMVQFETFRRMYWEDLPSDQIERVREKFFESNPENR
jgi:hypothetical protein